MTKEEIINHVADVVLAVFRAEDALRETWLPRLKAAHGKSKEEKEAIADSYVRAIAEEILSATPDEELYRLYADENID